MTLTLDVENRKIYVSEAFSLNDLLDQLFALNAEDEGDWIIVPELDLEFSLS